MGADEDVFVNVTRDRVECGVEVDADASGDGNITGVGWIIGSRCW